MTKNTTWGIINGMIDQNDVLLRGTMPKPNLDSTDKKILRILQADCRTPVSKIAERVNLSTSTCWRRINSLEASGIIDSFSIRLDPNALGLTFQAIVHVQLTHHERTKIDAFFEAIRSKPEVRECYAVTGQSDCHLIVSCPDISSYNRFLDDFLFQNPVVSSAQTNMVLKTIKRQDISV
ncbi:MAG: Lrp/AsnC family transcriptional regulator [Paracoccaceae bacterium]